MEYIVIYKRQEDHPIYFIEPKLIPTVKKVEELYPYIDPKQYGFLSVPQEIIDNMEIIEYETNDKGEIVSEPVFSETAKKISSKFDSAFNKNLLLFGEKIEEILSIKDLNDNKVEGSIADPERGIIEIGEKQGFFTVTCRKQTGRQPKIKSRKKNWEWAESEGEITGIRLIDEGVSKKKGSKKD